MISEGNAYTQWRDLAPGRSSRSAHDPAGRGVPAPSPAPFAATRLSSASATSGFLDNRRIAAPSSRRSASNCSTARENITASLASPFLPISLSRYGTVQSAVETCIAVERLTAVQLLLRLSTSTPSSAQHEFLSTSSASARAFGIARRSVVSSSPDCFITYSLCLCRNGSAQRFASASTGPQCGRSCLHSGLLENLHLLTPRSKYIAFPRGGFLQVAVSEAPQPRIMRLPTVPPWALQIQH